MLYKFIVKCQLCGSIDDLPLDVKQPQSAIMTGAIPMHGFHACPDDRVGIYVLLGYKETKENGT